MLFSMRRKVGKPCEAIGSINAIVSNDLLRYRGCRAGRHVQERRLHTTNLTSTTLPGDSCWSAPTEGINITTVVGRRFRGGYNHRSKYLRPRVLADLIRYSAPKQQQQQLGTVQAGFTPANILPPRLYVFNAAAITKPNAVQQLTADMTSMEIDVAIISETKLKLKHPDSIVCIDGYQIHRRDRRGRQGGGVAVYASNKYRSSIKSDFATVDHSNFELLWVELNDSSSKIYIGALYHPPQPIYDAKELLIHIERTIEELSTRHPEALIILGGDLNQLSESEITDRTGLVGIVHQPTRNKSCLDRVYVSAPCYSSVQVVTSAVKSDHKAVVAGCGSVSQAVASRAKHLTCRRKSPSQNSQFLRCLSSYDFGTEGSSVQKDFDNFYKASLSLLDKYYPEKQIKITPKDPDFITPEIKCKLRIKNKLMRKGRTEEAGQMAEQIGKDIARRNSISLRHINQRNGTKELWGAVRKLTKRKQEDQIPSGLNSTTLNKH